jgi:peptidoglycan/xylan/chitin deacetylase (PgdA/CDA1 family)
MKGTSMIIQTSWDDGCKEDLKLAEVLARYNLEATFYIPSEWQIYNAREGRDPLSFLDLRRLSKRFAIGSHSITHPLLTRIPPALAEAEIIDSKIQLEELLEVNIDSFCYPRGYASPTIREIVGIYYETARNTLVGNILPPIDKLWISSSVHVAGKRRPEYENTTWLKEAMRLLNEAIRRDKDGEEIVYSIFGHSWEISRYKAWDDLEVLLKALGAVNG